MMTRSLSIAVSALLTVALWIGGYWLLDLGTPPPSQPTPGLCESLGLQGCGLTFSDGEIWRALQRDWFERLVIVAVGPLIVGALFLLAGSVVERRLAGSMRGRTRNLLKTSE